MRDSPRCGAPGQSVLDRMETRCKPERRSDGSRQILSGASRMLAACSRSDRDSNGGVASSRWTGRRLTCSSDLRSSTLGMLARGHATSATGDPVSITSPDLRLAQRRMVQASDRRRSTLARSAALALPPRPCSLGEASSLSDVLQASLLARRTAAGEPSGTPRWFRALGLRGSPRARRCARPAAAGAGSSAARRRRWRSARIAAEEPA